MGYRRSSGGYTKLFNFESNIAQQSNLHQRHMASLVSWIKNQEGESKKLIINATNSDVSIINNQIITMGSTLQEDFEGKYYSIGLIFIRGHAYPMK